MIIKNFLFHNPGSKGVAPNPSSDEVMSANSLVRVAFVLEAALISIIALHGPASLQPGSHRWPVAPSQKPGTQPTHDAKFQL